MADEIKVGDADHVPLNPFYRWIGEQQLYLRSVKEQLHPAVFTMAMRMIPGVAELHQTDHPALVPDDEGGLTFAWEQDAESPVYGMEIYLAPPNKPAEEFREYSPWKPVHPPGVWR